MAKHFPSVLFRLLWMAKGLFIACGLAVSLERGMFCQSEGTVSIAGGGGGGVGVGGGMRSDSQ